MIPGPYTKNEDEKVAFKRNCFLLIIATNIDFFKLIANSGDDSLKNGVFITEDIFIKYQSNIGTYK